MRRRLRRRPRATADQAARLRTLSRHGAAAANSEKRRIANVPANFLAEAERRRTELVEKLVDVDDQLAELVLDEKPVTEADLQAAIRRATVSLKFSPVMMVRPASRLPAPRGQGRPIVDPCARPWIRSRWWPACAGLGHQEQGRAASSGWRERLPARPDRSAQPCP